MRHQHETTFQDQAGNAHQYVTIQFGASDGLRLLGELVRLSGDAMGRATDAMAVPAAGRALTALGERLASQPGFVRELLAGTRRDGQPLSQQAVFDGAYQGNYGELLEALLWVLTVNFQSGVQSGPLAPLLLLADRWLELFTTPDVAPSPPPSGTPSPASGTAG